jgi:hypothetical protein
MPPPPIVKSFMVRERRFSFDAKIMKHNLTSSTLVLGLGLLSLVGCAQTYGPGLLSDLRLATSDKAEDVRVIAEVPAEKELVLVVPDGQKPKVPKQIIVPASAKEQASAWCKHIEQDTYAQTIIMRSPSLNGGIDDNAKASLSLGLSLRDQLKANLLEESIDIKCRRYLAEAGLQKLIFVSPQGLTAAGHRAKAKAIMARKKDIAALRRKASAALQDGSIDRGNATAITVLADQILAEAAASLSHADRRLDAVVAKTGEASYLSRELLASESDLEDINSRMRTLDAFDLSASVGWSDDINNNGIQGDQDSFSGKVSFSVKLGAFAPQRYDYEEQAKQAKLKAIASEEGGVLWQISTLRRAHERAIAGLVSQRVKLDEALAEAKRLNDELAGVDAPEFIGAQTQARLQIIKLKADREAVAGSIAEIEANMKKLKSS